MSDNGQENPGDKPAAPRKGRVVRSPLNGAEIVPGNPGNRGGQPGRSGRTPWQIRQAARLLIDERMPLLADMVDGRVRGVSGAARVQAAALLYRIGMEARADVIPIDDLRHRLQATLDTLRALLPGETAQQIVDAIKVHWKAP